MVKPETKIHNSEHLVTGEIGETFAFQAETFGNQVMMAREAD